MSARGIPFGSRLRLPFVVRVYRVLVPGSRLQALLRRLKSSEQYGRLASISLESEPYFQRALIPTVRLMQVTLRVAVDSIEAPSFTVIYSFPSTQTAEENLSDLEDFLVPPERLPSVER